VKSPRPPFDSVLGETPTRGPEQVAARLETTDRSQASTVAAGNVVNAQRTGSKASNRAKNVRVVGRRSGVEIG